MENENHFTIAASTEDSTYLVIHMESGQQFPISREELQHLYVVCGQWIKEREAS